MFKPLHWMDDIKCADLRMKIEEKYLDSSFFPFQWVNLGDKIRSGVVLSNTDLKNGDLGPS